MAEEEDLREILSQTADDFVGKKSIPSGLQSPLADDKDVDIDDEQLSEFLVSALKNDIADGVGFGLLDDRDYNLRSYYQVRDEFFANNPWANASNFIDPIIPTLVDTGQAAIEDLLFRNKLKAIIVEGVGKEDRISARNLEKLYNWQFLNDIKRFVYEMSGNLFQMLLHGTSYLKIVKTIQDGRYGLKVVTIPIERMFLPIDRSSPEIGDTDRITQIVPLQAYDLKERMNAGVYRNLDKVTKGLNIGGDFDSERQIYLESQITGLDLSGKQNRDTYFIAETPVTYYPKGSIKKRELIVTWSPNTGAIHRKIENKDGIRSLVDYFCYPNYGKAYHRSLPSILRGIQEKANYTDKQITDASDKAMNPAGFFNQGAGVFPKLMLRAPSSMQSIQNLNGIYWEPVNIAPILERKQESKDLWLKARTLSGFTGLYEGKATEETLGQEVLAKERTDIRANKLLRFINESWSRTVMKAHQYNDIYMPRDMVIDVLGTDEQYSIEQMFPYKGKERNGNRPKEGLRVGSRFNYSIANKTIAEEERENQNKNDFATQVLLHPILGQNVDNVNRAFEKKGEAMGIMDTSEYFNKPKESYDISPEEVVQRIMNGEKDIPPAIFRDPTEYEIRIKVFMRTENFALAPNEVKFEFMTFLENLEAIRRAKIMANKAFMLSQTQQAVQGERDFQAGKQSIDAQNLQQPAQAL